MKKTSDVLIILINIIFGIAETLIGLRIILKLFGANPGADFVNWLYQTTQPLLAPFIGMFPSPSLEGRFVIEFSALFALIIYGLINYLLVEIVRSFSNPKNNTSDSDESV